MRLLSPNAALLLSAFLNRSGSPQYGYELMQETGIKSGSLYPVLGRFEKLGWITGEMEELAEGRPPRRFYRFNAECRPAAEQALQRFLDSRRVPEADRLGWGLA